MNESQKTLTFIGVALLALILAWEPWVREAKTPTEFAGGEKLFPDFKNTLAATNLNVVEYDEATSVLRPFSIKQVGGVWAIPSHQNYPADARDHLAQAATALFGLQTLGLVSNNSGEHSVYGVV